jgi:hypothetical protein
VTASAVTPLSGGAGKGEGPWHVGGGGGVKLAGAMQSNRCIVSFHFTHFIAFHCNEMNFISFQAGWGYVKREMMK